MTAREAYEAYDRPLCECHGEAMCWHMDTRRSAGGYWRCAAKHREYYRANRDKRLEYYRHKRINDPVWALTRDISAEASRRKARREALYG